MESGLMILAHKNLDKWANNKQSESCLNDFPLKVPEPNVSMNNAIVSIRFFYVINLFLVLIFTIEISMKFKTCQSMPLKT